MATSRSPQVKSRVAKLLSLVPGDFLSFALKKFPSLVTIVKQNTSFVLLLGFAVCCYWVYWVSCFHCEWFGPGTFLCGKLDLCASVPLCAYVDVFNSTAELVVLTNKDSEHYLVLKNSPVAFQVDLWTAMAPFQGYEEADAIITSLRDSKKGFDNLLRDTQIAYRENAKKLNSITFEMKPFLKEIHLSLHAWGGEWTVSVRQSTLIRAMATLANASTRLSSKQNCKPLAQLWENHQLFLKGISRKLGFLEDTLLKSQLSTGQQPVPFFTFGQNKKKQPRPAEVILFLQSFPAAVKAVNHEADLAGMVSQLMRTQAERLENLRGSVDDAQQKIKGSSSGFGQHFCFHSVCLHAFYIR